MAVYTPNSGRDLGRLDYRVKEWDRKFFEYLKSLEGKGKAVICCGDLNVANGIKDIFDPNGREKAAGFTPQEKKSFNDFLTNDNFIDTFRHLYPDKMQFTYFSNWGNCRALNKGWRLDYFLIDKKSIVLVKDSQVHNEYFGSDHCPVSLQLDL